MEPVSPMNCTIHVMLDIHCLVVCTEQKQQTPPGRRTSGTDTGILFEMLRLRWNLISGGQNHGNFDYVFSVSSHTMLGFCHFVKHCCLVLARLFFVFWLRL